MGMETGLGGVTGSHPWSPLLAVRLLWVENVLDKLCFVPFVYYRRFRIFGKYLCLTLLAGRILLLAL